jgi:diguanylate cyclase (GGDEF)-like protein/PAS domain S-box-containing protein
MKNEDMLDDFSGQTLSNLSVGFEARLAYDKLTFFYISQPIALVGQIAAAFLLAAMMLTEAELVPVSIWFALNAVHFLYRFYHYFAFKRASEYEKLRLAKRWLHKYYTNVLISGIIWGSSAILLFPEGNLIGQMVIVLFLFAVSFTSMGVLASKPDLLLTYAQAVFLPIILRFFFVEKGEDYVNIAYAVVALMLIVLLVSYYFGRVINSALSSHQHFVEIKHSHDKLKERFFSLFERAPVGIYYYDRNLHIQDVNTQFQTMHRVAFKEDLSGRETAPPSNRPLLDAHKAVLRNHSGNYRGPYGRFFSDDILYVELSTVPMHDSNGEVTGGISIIKDITAEVTAREKMLRSAYYDMLTEVPNRTLLLDRLNRAIGEMRHVPEYAALLFIDADNFKKVNDTYGHNVGDDVIRQLAYRLEDSVGDDEMAARIGGDKFAVLLGRLGRDPDSASHRATERVTEIKRRFGRPVKLGGEDYRMSVSAGVAVFHGHDGTAFDILKRAETAMYHAKKSGRNTISFYSERMGLIAREELKLEHELYKALRDGGELHMVYQPQVVVETGELIGAEALVRWRHGEEGQISPARFIAVAEACGMIVELENWIFERIFREMQHLAERPEGFPLHHIAINVSAIHFLQPHFVAQFMMLVNRFEIDPGWIELELTESEVMHNIHEAILKIRELRTFGIRFSIDDFGTGYSSFAYLKQLPVNVLKVDQTFVMNMADNEGDALIVSAIISIARKFQLEVLAEGVEDACTLRQLKGMSCNTYQGYYAYKPMPFEMLKKLLG